jgi:type I restriction enzyme S subunit
VKKNKLPDGWSIERLSNLCVEDKIIIDGKDSKLPFLGLEMIKSDSGVIDWAAKTMEGNGTCYYFDQRHVLYSKLRPYLNKVVLPNASGRCSTELVPLYPNNRICREYLVYLLRRKETIEYVMSEKTGSRMPRANIKYLLTMDVPLPPIEVQNRIVKIIETKLKSVEKTKQAVEEQKSLSRLLFFSYLQKKISNKKWNCVKLGEICEFIGGSQPPKSTFLYSPKKDYIRLVQIQDFRKDNVAVYIPRKTVRKTFKKDDIMIGRYGPPVFQIFRGLEGAYNVALMKAQPKDEDILVKNFLFYLLQERSLQSAVINQSQRSAGQSGVDKKFLEERFVYLPDIKIQKAIAESIDKYKIKVSVLDNLLKDRSSYIEALQYSILRQAFRGEL